MEARENEVYWIDFEVFNDPRGDLTVVESRRLPFAPARFFFSSVHEDSTERGAHAHKECWQILFCISGEIDVYRTWKSGSEVYHLRSDGKALVVPPGNWCKQVFHSSKSILGVIASHSYNPDDYIYGLEEFDS